MEELFWDLGTEKAAIGNGPTMVDNDKFDGAGGAVSNGISRTGAAGYYSSDGSLGHRNTQPRGEVRLFSDIDDQPLLRGVVTGVAKLDPAISREDLLNGELYLKTIKD